jgi:hypothetical protein
MSLRVLILFAHPAFQKSRINRRLLRAVQGLENVRIHDLYEEYPDFQIDVEREQKLLLDHDIIVLQHPFFWYSGPALLMLLPKNGHAQRSGVIRYDTRLKLDKQKTVDGGP